MKRYGVAEFRRKLARALDEVERGEPVVVERGGRRYRIVPERAPARSPKAKPFFELLDRSLLERGWTWEWSAPGVPLRLRKGRPKRT